MSSKLVTPPDLHTGGILVINASQSELVTLILWLKSVPDIYTLHLYNEHMNDLNWLRRALTVVDHVLLCDSDEDITDIVSQSGATVTKFGPGTDYNFAVDYFLANRSQ